MIGATHQKENPIYSNHSLDKQPLFPNFTLTHKWYLKTGNPTFTYACLIALDQLLKILFTNHKWKQMFLKQVKMRYSE